MVTADAVTTYFAGHLRCRDWAALSTDTQTAAVNMANSDISGELDELDLTDSDVLHVSAVAEQALHLANTGGTGGITSVAAILSESVDGVGSRSYDNPAGNTAICPRAAEFVNRIRRSYGRVRIIR